MSDDDDLDWDLPAEGASWDWWRAQLRRALGREPSGAEIEGARRAVAGERRRRRSLRAGARERAELRAELEALRARLRRRRARREAARGRAKGSSPSGHTFVLDFLGSLEGQALLAVIGGLADTLAAAMRPDPWLGWDARHPYGPGSGPRPRRRRPSDRELAKVIMGLAEAKLGRLEREAEARALAAAREELERLELPRAAVAWLEAAHPGQVSDLVDRLATARRTGPNSVARELRQLYREGAAAWAEWPQLGNVSTEPPRGLLPVPPPPEEEDEPARTKGEKAAPAPGRRPG